MTENRTQRVVIAGVDGSEDGLRATKFAAGSAKARSADLLIIHAVDDNGVAGAWGFAYDRKALEEVGQAIVEDAIKVALEQGLDKERIHGEVIVGNPAALLADRSEKAELIVVGRRATSGLERMFVGSTSVAIAGMASCPVIVISQAATPHPVGDKHKVAIAVGPQTSNTKTLTFACDQAKRYDAELEVVTVTPPLPAGATGGYKLTDESMERMISELDQRLAEIADPVVSSYPEVPCHRRVLTGQPVDELVSLSETVDQLIIGVNKHPLLGWTAGGVARGIMAHAKCPLGIVH